MHKAIRVLALAGLLLGATAQSAMAEKPADPNCWGTVVSQRATTYHDVGAHASAQEEPRIGVGNIGPELGLGEHPSDVAALLAQIDDQVGQDPLGATHCP